jgi:hypothetical protein
VVAIKLAVVKGKTFVKRVLPFLITLSAIIEKEARLSNLG